MRWKEASIGAVAKLRTKPILVEEDRSYKRCRVQTQAKGIVLRDTVRGIDIKTKKQWVVRANDFLVAEIDAKVGGYGIVPCDLDGAIVSSHYFAYELDATLIEPKWLDLFIRTTRFSDQVGARGSTNYSAVRPQAIALYTVPIPSLEDQTRIINRVESLHQLISAAERTARHLRQDFEYLLRALAHRSDLSDEQKRRAGWRKAALSEIIRLDLQVVKVDPDAEYPNLGIYSFGRGAFKKNAISGLQTSATQLFRVKKGQFIYSRLFAFEGSYAHVTPEFDGHFVSGEYPTFTCDPSACRAEFLFAYFKEPSVWETLSHNSKGLGLRRQRVQPGAILAHEAWIPPLHEQNQIAEVLTAQRRYQELDTFEADVEALRRSILSKAFRGEL